MLTELTIRNFAIIDELKVHFSEGLNIITGETGAGKSIIINALALIMGDRASADLIRTGEDAAQVEAVFDLHKKQKTQEILARWGIKEKEEIVVKRIISRSGKSRAYINGEAVTASQLSLLGEELLNICGQHEHQLLLNEQNHITILDAYANLGDLIGDYGQLFHRVNELEDEIRSQEEIRKRRAEMRELLDFQYREIEEVAPQLGEDERLLEERRVLTNAQRLKELAFDLYEELYGGDGSILEKLGRLRRAVEEIKKIDGHFQKKPDEVESVYYQLEEIAHYARSYGQSLDINTHRLSEVEERLEKLNRLKKKYGGSIEAVLARKDEIARELADNANLEEELEKKRKEWEDKYRELELLSRQISDRRQEAARHLEEELAGELCSLMMEKAQFKVDLRETALNRLGRDNVSFLFTANPGEELKPLHKVASGGELSRLMLALKKVLADRGFAGTIIFDEVDSGIGGATAEVVGEKIEEVAYYNQVICITHLPQIARFAHRHLRVEKKVSDGKTVTSISDLDEVERREELARMLGGREISTITLEHATELLATKARKGGSYAEEGQG
ncbi:MAG: DNA repair protein RecN [Syntrophales bacterium]|nr:DNA repair protein RecN [Syntrophales bacterium]